MTPRKIDILVCIENDKIKPKIVDFGIAILEDNNTAVTKAGTLPYIAPGIDVYCVQQHLFACRNV
jgi:serine/threonine protein kinase